MCSSDLPGRAQQPVSFAGQCQKFARAGLRPLERVLAHEPFADKTLAVLVELLPTAVIGVLREVFQSNDAEFPEFCDRLNLRFAQAISAIPVIKRSTARCEVNWTWLLL